MLITFRPLTVRAWFNSPETGNQGSIRLLGSWFIRRGWLEEGAQFCVSVTCCMLSEVLSVHVHEDGNNMAECLNHHMDQCMQRPRRDEIALLILFVASSSSPSLPSSVSAAITSSPSSVSLKVR
jgi:hypothetical protein